MTTGTNLTRKSVATRLRDVHRIIEYTFLAFKLLNYSTSWFSFIILFKVLLMPLYAYVILNSLFFAASLLANGNLTSLIFSTALLKAFSSFCLSFKDIFNHSSSVNKSSNEIQMQYDASFLLILKHDHDKTSLTLPPYLLHIYAHICKLHIYFIMIIKNIQ